ncbi:MAG: hypothetical protein K9J13_15600 [Saprospiraceae bacterium]|nr:hypothetical protein [Saprospiraceae bacterium]
MKSTVHTVLFLLLVIPLVTQSQNLELYCLSLIQKSDSTENGFVIFTDNYSQDNYPDSLAIYDKYLADIEANKNGYYELSLDYRIRFLENMNISKNAIVFIYNFILDTTFTYNVNELHLVAQFAPNHSYNSQYDYVVGFSIAELPLKELGDNYSYTLIYIGESSSFHEGNIQPLLWEKIESQLFPADTNGIENAHWYKQYTSGESYICSYNGFDYFLQNLIYKGRISARHLNVVDSTGITIYNKVYYDTELTPLVPLTEIVDNYFFAQWTGEIFKNKPPIIFGFCDAPYGGSIINFVSLSEPSIYIRCYNEN